MDDVSQNNDDVLHAIPEISDSEKLEKLLSLATDVKMEAYQGLLSLDTDVKMEAYQGYIKDGKYASRQGNISKALELFKLAHESFPNEKLKSGIKKLEEILAQQDSESDDDDEFVDVNKSGLMLYKKLCDNLYDHQIEGVAFLYSLYRDGREGGILADDMGLGKTIQVISFLSGMYDADLVKHTLLVMPTSLMKKWTKEFAKWSPGIRVEEFHGISQTQRNGNLEKIQRTGGVIITTYQMLINNGQQLASYNGQEFTWDYVILDEAHKIKSSTKTAKSAAAIPSINRVLLTGTPVQNNLKELWALFDFACQRALLGPSETFKAAYENPITRARENDATPGEKALGLKLSNDLMAIINPYFLRRTKADVQMKKAQQDSESEDDEFVDVNKSGLMINKKLCDKLYHHQIEGVAFLYSLYRDGRKGGILAHDMGLGKTIQVISFLSGMYDADLVKHTLLVMPTSLIKNWTKEFAKWSPGIRVKEFHGSKTQRNGNLEKIQRTGGVIITTYQMLINNRQQLASYNGQEFTWDYVILDEAHKIKSSSTKTAKSAAAIPSKNRVLLTGTPVQNNLKELWALFDFACQGALLGTSNTFKAEYDKPITRAREKDATPGEKALGLRLSENLMARINPYFLRRTKADVQKEKEAPNHSKGAGAEMPDLTRKNDLIVWTYLSPVQEDFYQQFISLDHIKELLMTTKSPLAELNVLKKLCDHPRLLSQRAIAHLGLDQKASTDFQDENEPAKNSIANVPDETLISESGKLVFLIALLEKLREEGHRMLVFARFRMILDILERVLNNRGFKTVRLDGTITQLAEREKRISRFQTDKRYSVFLLTTQVGGVGITLTAADRVVIFDPSWNPATDSQAVDRAYRIGQTQNVVIYRLITCGTLEEKIYRRQVFKDSLIRQTTGDEKNPFRYFSKQELRELFTLQDTRSSSTQLHLQSLHSMHRRTDPELDEHIAYLHTMEIFGISDHDLMFSMDVNNHEDDPEDQQSHQYIEQRVWEAQQLMKKESQMQLADNMASSTEPAWLRQPAQDNTGRSNEKRQKREKPGPYFHNHYDKLNTSLELVDLTQTGSSDLVGSDVEAADESDESVQEVMETWFSAVGAVEKRRKKEKPSPSFHNHNDELNASLEVVDLTEHGSGDFSAYFEEVLSDVEAADESVQEVIEGPQHSEINSFNGNFNVQPKDSEMDMFQDDEIITEQETHAQQSQLLLKLQVEGSFNVDEALSVKSVGECVQSSCVTEQDVSEDDGEKKRPAVIYDSEEEDDDDRPQSMANELHDTLDFGLAAASTPKSVRSGSLPPKASESFGGNTSVAAKHPHMMTMIENLDEDVEDEVLEGMDDDVSEDMNDVSPREEEPSGEMRDAENEEEESAYASNDSVPSVSEMELGEEADGELEESTTDAVNNTGSDQVKDVNSSKLLSAAEDGSYESLVKRGKQCYGEGKLHDALDLFLRAIDISSGDAEIQLMTIQLYRQLNPRTKN